MDPATVTLVTQVVGSLGFPIFVAVWLLLRTDKLLMELLTAVHNLPSAVADAVRKVG